MPGGIHPPPDVVASWPHPNYVDPVTRSMAATIIASVFGPITLFLAFARLWVRLRIQRNGSWDDWLMIAAIPPIIVLSIIIPLSADKYSFNKHVWDVKPPFYVIQRKYIMAIESTFCVAAGLVKISILLFYRRISARAVSNTFKWTTRVTIGFIAAYSIAFTLVPIFGCQPISAFWNQSDIVKIKMGYKYKCFNEGADVFAAAVISTAQDMLTAILPTFIFWNLQIPVRQKIALFGIFAIAYGVVAFGAMRAYVTWQIFFETYDVSWVVWEIWNWTLLEIYGGAMCANAPALKVLFKQYFQPEKSSYRSQSQSRSNGSRTKNSNNSRSSDSRSVSSKLGLWKSSHAKNGYLSEPHTDISVDQLGGVRVQRDVDIRYSAAYTPKEMVAGAEQYPSVNIEMGTLKAQYNPSNPTISAVEDMQALPQTPSQQDAM